MQLEMTPFGAFSFDLLISSVLYMVLALQLHAGWPPFHKPFSYFGMRSEDDVEISPAVIAIFTVMACIVAAFFFGWQILLLVGAFAPLWAGWTLRQRLKHETNGVLPWLIHPITLKWPMALFDAWTIGLAGLVLWIGL